MKIFVINPGSTSTKLALYEDDKPVWKHTLAHSVDDLSHFGHVNEQLDYRTKMIYEAIADAGIDKKFDAVIARGGLLRPTPGGVYLIDDKIKDDLLNSPNEHACNLGALMADILGSDCHCPAFIADPEVVDERIPESAYTGMPEVPRASIFHALNGRAVSRQYASSIGRSYEDLNLIVVHLGGGISVSAHCHGRVIDTNDALNGDGPFSPERTGAMPAIRLAELCYSGKYTLAEMKKKIVGKGGLAAYLGTSDVALIAEKASRGEQPFAKVLDAMVFSVAKEVGARQVSMRGKVDAIILTGGIAHSTFVVDKIKYWIDFIAPVIVRAGEDELGSLAFNAYGALSGRFPIQTYDPDSVASPVCK